MVFRGKTGRSIRLSEERGAHILEHPEMIDQLERIRETLVDTDLIVRTRKDETVVVYHRFYPSTPVTRKFLLVVVKQVEVDAFVLTAFFSNRSKNGVTLWQR